jgi:hypothetical protein
LLAKTSFMLRTLGEIGRNIEEVKMVEDESKD